MQSHTTRMPRGLHVGLCLLSICISWDNLVTFQPTMSHQIMLVHVEFQRLLDVKTPCTIIN